MSWDKGPGLLNKVTIPCPKNSSLNLLACHDVSRTSLDSVTEDLTVLLFWGKISIFIHLVIYQGEGNDTPLQYSCLENPMDGGAW